MIRKFVAAASAAFVPWIIKCGYIAKLTLSSINGRVLCVVVQILKGSGWLASISVIIKTARGITPEEPPIRSDRRDLVPASSSSAAASGWPGLSRVRYRIVVDMVMMSPRVPAAAQKQNHLDSKEKLGQLN